MPFRNPSDDEIRALLEGARTIAVVGASSNPERPSHGVMQVLLDTGYRVFPVNPNEREVLGQRAYASLAELPEAPDIVDVFRRAEATPAIADEAVRAKARVLWLQQGISNDDAAARASQGGLTVVMDECIGATVRLMRISPRPAERPAGGPADLVEEASEESFPASDPPAFTPGHAGSPNSHDTTDRGA